MTESQRKSMLVILIPVLLIASIGAIYIIYQYSQTHPPILETIVFEYTSPESQGLSNDSITELADTVQSYFDEEFIVGAELVVIKNRKIVLHEVFGWNDRENQIPMEKNTLFNIRSMTKTITGAAIQILIDEGRLHLNNSAANYLPGFDNENSNNISIEQLLTHRSGLPLSIIKAADEYETLNSMANEIGTRGPEFAPGSKFWYSDAGTEVLGAIIEVETGMSLDSYITQMNHSILLPLALRVCIVRHWTMLDSWLCGWTMAYLEVYNCYPQTRLIVH